MQLWSPPHDRPHLFEWWRPLLLASARARRQRIHWPIHLDEFRLAGRVVRSARPDIWIYEHHDNGGSVCVDATGTTYRFIATPRARGPGRFEPCEIRSAVWQARLPDVVDPVWYDERPRRGADAWRRAVETVAPADLGGASDASDSSGASDASDLDQVDDAPDVAELREVSGGAAGAPVGGAVRRGHLTVIVGGRSHPAGDRGGRTM
jgi:hypothetical protein